MTAAPARRRRSLAYLGVGVALAALLAVVLFAGVGVRSGSSAGGETATQQDFTRPDVQPGINAATGLLLSLTVFPSSSHKQAANFELTDQYGRPVSMDEFRGKVVVFAANDDRCTDLCTLLANDIVSANHDLGAAARDVVWLSVNANPFYPQVSAVKAWTDEHGLGDQPNWYYGTAAPRTLEAVWSKYGFYVQLDRKNRTVVHSTELFFVDPSGTERSVANFGVDSASTALFAHGMAQMADDLLPASERVHVAGPETPTPTKTNATVGAPAPVFSLPYLESGRGRFDLLSTRGRWTVLNFWSSTCTVCRTELPNVEAAYRADRSEVDFVGVDVADRSGAAKAMARRAGLTYPLVSDPDGVASGAERITGLPFTVVVGPRGNVVIRHPGAITTEQLTYLLANYLPSLPQT